MNELVQVNSAKSCTDSKVQLFNNKEFGDVRVIIRSDEPWFVGKDVATALGYAKPENAIATHVDEEDKTTTLIQGTGSNYKSNAVIINESGVYSLILSSKLPNAKKFKRWVTSEVLPSIRKHGGYISPTGYISPEFLEQMAQQMRNAQMRIEWLEVDNDDLREQIGDNTYYKQVKALPWLLEYFAKSDAMYKAVGKHLSWLSRKMGKQYKVIENSEYGSLHAYHIDVINAFHEAIENDGTLLEKYRKEENA